MTPQRRLVLDANILLRSVFGTNVLPVLKHYEEHVAFYSPAICFEDAEHILPKVAKRQNLDPSLAFAIRIVACVEVIAYAEFEVSARARISARDPEDWPIVATALLLNAPIWTEDRDFFGSGIATWTTDRIEIYLRNS